MRVIEKKMLEAIKAKKDWLMDNTQVIYYPDTNSSGIFLHSNHIATYWHSIDCLKVDRFTLARWPSSTTKSRLRALGVNVYTRKGVTYLNDKEI